MASQALKAPAPTGEGEINGDQYLSFRCMGMSLALPISRIREIIEFGPLTAVPHMPDYVRGVINLRGNVVSVVDLAARFSGKRSEGGRRACIVIVDLDVYGDLQRVGLMVDSVDAVLDIDPATIEPPPRFGAGLRSEGIAGMARREEGFTVILKADQIITDEQLGVLSELAAQAALPAPSA
jgi:purine-binding chemotaxis protein CheW